MKKFLVPISISIAVALSLISLVISFSKSEFLGAGKTIQTYKPVVPSDGTIATSSKFIGDVIPENNNNEDLGQYGNAWRGVYTSGTIRSGGNLATSTIDLRTSGSNGTCFILSGTNGTTYFVNVTSTQPAFLTASTIDCR